MISVVIATHESEHSLVHTLAALVPGALSGVVREVIVVDAGSQDDTGKVADVAGCRFIVQPGGALGARLAAGATTARADWLWFIPPGCVPQAGWDDEAERFIRAHDGDSVDMMQAAVLRRPRASSALRELFALFATSLGAKPRPEQGLLITKSLYRRLGGLDAASADPQKQLMRKLGRHRIVVLGCAMTRR